MDNFTIKLNHSKKRLSLADYMLTNTYSMLKEPKILVSVLENIFLAFNESLSSLLDFERAFKRVPSFGTSFESMSNVYISKVQNRYKLDKSFIKVMNEIKETIDYHKSSPVEFERKEKIVMANERYDLKTISKDKVYAYLMKAKEFAKKVETIQGEYND